MSSRVTKEQPFGWTLWAPPLPPSYFWPIQCARIVLWYTKALRRQLLGSVVKKRTKGVKILRRDIKIPRVSPAHKVWHYFYPPGLKYLIKSLGGIFPLILPVLRCPKVRLPTRRQNWNHRIMIIGKQGTGLIHDSRVCHAHLSSYVTINCIVITGWLFVYFLKSKKAGLFNA